MNDGLTNGEITDFDPDVLPEGVHITEHVHERSTIVIRIGDRAWLGAGTFDDVCRANNGMVRNHELSPGTLQLRIALRRALNQILGRLEDQMDPDGMTWGDACSILGEIRREGSEGSGSCTMVFVTPVHDGRSMRFIGRGKDADEACLDLARTVLRWSSEHVG